jgi:hypothetical protein
MKKFLRDLLPQRLNAVAELCVSLCLTSYNWTCFTLALCHQERCVRLHRDEQVVGVDQEKGSCAYVLGKMTLAIELCKSIGH